MKNRRPLLLLNHQYSVYLFEMKKNITINFFIGFIIYFLGGYWYSLFTMIILKHVK